MQRAGFNVVVGSFQKNSTVYHVAITVPSTVEEKKETNHEYKILFSHPLKKTVSFKIKLDEDGQWIPDKRNLIDPWIANNIGNIIECKILGSKDGISN
jgi:hypothetical protein